MRDYLLTLCVVAAVTFLLTGPARTFALAIGAAPAVRARDVHRQPTPRLGGIAMFGGLCAGWLVAAHLPHLADTFTRTHEPQALLVGAAVIWLIGVLDDRFELAAVVKFVGQLIAASIMVAGGLAILWLPVPGVGAVILNEPQSTLLTVAVVVVTINAVNFIDGLDGLAAGMVAIAATAFLLYSYRLWYGYGIEAAQSAAMFSAALVGMCVGFLPHNSHPARIFMGDSGSMLIGTVLAACCISAVGQVDPDALAQSISRAGDTTEIMAPIYIPVLLSLTAIAVPAIDLVLAFMRRTWRGQSPFTADKEHLHHRLIQIGHSHPRAVLLMYLWTALLTFGTVAIAARHTALWTIMTLMALCAAGIVFLTRARTLPSLPRCMAPLVPPRFRRSKRRS
ncbi:undecaprenyl/decaprenyl-phosphate alpha-N-acetylglucosaminyl 1-phosphate transferase [Streptomyces sp. TRM66268-LWL]|uniref:Undecaprenyl/decaprenyl-phosphate alpha-N-acetylglucosaminyl 1-phosphate transferase n=1 Tax=Streptomyces polyasparticus TaxID=2767826 RepID=A0ABR7STI9_9ACTN|nr:MraY family glycosyltransferase [Streptomyces polyasparticus]MBC9717851.1 undecaprenyl/decaprenyl-phosphate alpha-N-acetylglucosaminyl 1-phosphate transferase [Streptomyces polyasparticus]